MTGAYTQQLAAIGIGLLAAVLDHVLFPETDWIVLAVIAASGYLGVHLPSIQQPSTPPYQVVRAASALIAFLLPLEIYAYRPTDLLLAWVASYLLYHGLWWITDRISLYRDYTRHLAVILFLPVCLTSLAYSAFGTEVVLPVFLASSIGYIGQLLLEQRSAVSKGLDVLQD